MYNYANRNDNVVTIICDQTRNGRRLTVCELVNEAGISIGVCHEILHRIFTFRKLQTRRVARGFAKNAKINGEQELGVFTRIMTVIIITIFRIVKVKY